MLQSLENVKDFRAVHGRRYPLWLILLLVIKGTISGGKSYYALEEFGTRHWEALGEELGLTIKRFPSETTFRRVGQKLDFALCSHSSLSSGQRIMLSSIQVRE